MDTDQFYTLYEVAGWAHLPVPFLRTAIRKAHLKAYHFDRYYVTLEDFNAFVSNGKAKLSPRGRPRKK